MAQQNPVDRTVVDDQMAIHALLVKYCRAVDSRELDLFDEIFTDDAHIDHRAMGSSCGNPAERKAFLATALSRFSACQHLLGNVEISVDGDSASARSLCHNPMISRGDDGRDIFSFYGLWYVDRLVRTANGWRICHRVAERGFAFSSAGVVS